jgi:hypothetical protein
MPSTKKKPSAGAKPGLMEYCLLTALLLVVVVTAWTLIDNGLVDTISGLIDPGKP